MNVKIRPATREDARFVAWVELAAARSHVPKGYYDLAFPGDEEQRLSMIEKLACAQARSFCHYSGFLIAEVDGRPAAGLSGYVPRIANTELFIKANQEVLTAAGWTEAEMYAMGERTSSFLSCIPDTPPDAWVVEWVATLPEYRGRGLVRTLLQEILAKGRAGGHEVAQIAVLIGNTPAQHAYEGAGFTVKDEKRDAEFERVLGCPGIRRLMMTL